MSNYEDRIIGLKFDNAQFEKRAQKTLNTLDSMTQKIYTLGTRSVTSSFNSISNAAAKVTLNPLHNAVNNVILSFKNLETRTITSLETMAMTALNAGKQFAESLSVDQFAAGWTKYEEKTAAVQTIVAAGYELEEVNAAMDKLMWYADETSYNFTDMANNIGKFTAMGIDLDTATKSMMGISNWAAVSGQNAASASRAMYNLSQAIGMGKVTLRDWYSIENANMATKQFKETVLDTAVNLGTLKKAEDGTIKTTDGTVVSFENFRDVLDKGFFTTEVLTATLERYNGYTEEVYKLLQNEALGFETAAEAMEYLDKEIEKGNVKLEDLAATSFKAAQEAKSLTEALNATKDAVSSAWLRIIENVTGGYYETKKLWTDFTQFLWDVFAGPLDEIESYVSKWMSTPWFDEESKKELTEREHLLQIFYALMDGIVDALGVAKKAFLEVFPAKTIEELSDLVEMHRQLAKALVFTNDKTGELTEKGKKLKGVLLGIFSIFKNIINFGKKFKSTFEPLFKSLKDLFTDIADFFLLFNRALPLAKKTPKWLESLTSKIQNGVKIVSDLAESVRSYLVPALNLITNHGVFGVIAVLTKGFGGLSDTIFDLVSNFTGLDTSIYKSKAKDLIYAIGNKLLVIAQIIKAVIKPALTTGLTIAATLISRIVSLVKIVIGLIANTWEPLGKIFISLLNAGKKILDAIFEVAPDLSNVIGKFLTAAQPIISKIINVLADGLVFIIKLIPKIIDGATQVINFFKSFGSDTIKGFFNGLKEGFKNSKIYGIFEGLIEKVKNILGIHSPSTVFADIGYNVMMGLYYGVKKFGPVKKFIKYGRYLLQVVSGILNQIKDPIIKAVNSIFNAITRIFDSINPKELFGYVASIIDRIFSLLDRGLSIIERIFDKVLSSGLLDEIIEFLKYFFKALVRTDVVKIFADTLLKLVDILASAFSFIIEMMNSPFMKVALHVVEQALWLFGKLLELGSTFISKVIKGLEASAIKPVEIEAVAAAIETVAKAVGFLAITLAAARIFWNIGGMMKQAKGTMKEIKDIFGSLSDLLENKVKSKKSSNFMKGMQTVAATIITVMVSITAITYMAKDMSMGQIISLFAGLSTVFMAIAAFAVILSKIKFKAAQVKNITKLMSAIDVMLLSLTAVAIGMSFLAKNDWKSILTAAGAIAIVFTAVLGGIIVLSLLSDKMKKIDWSSILVSIAMLASVVAGLVIVSSILPKLADESLWGSLAKAGVILAGFIVVLAAMGAIGKYLGTGLGIVTLAMLGLAASFLAFSAGVLILASAIDIFVTAIEKMVNITKESGDSIAESIRSTAQGMAEGIIGFLTTITDIAPFVTGLFQTAKDIVVASLTAIWDGIVEFMLNIVNKKEDLETIFEGLKEILGSFIDNALELVNEKGPAIIDTVVSLISTAIDKIKEYDIIGKAGGLLKQLLKTISDNSQDIIDTLETITSSALESLKNLSPQVADTINTLITDALTDLMSEQKLGKIVTSVLEFVEKTLDKLIEKAPDLVGKLMTLIIAILDESSKWIFQVTDSVTKLAVNIIGAITVSSISITNAVMDAIVNIISDLANSIYEKGPKIVNALEKLVVAITYVFGYLVGKSLSAAGKGITAFIQGFWAGVTDLGKSIKDVFKSIGDAFESVFDENSPSKEAWDIGAYLSEGLANGIKSGQSKVESASASVATSALDKMNKKLEIHSPSKKGIEMGEYLDEGLVIGIENGSSDVASAAENTAQSAIDGMTDTAEKSEETVASSFANILSKVKDTLGNGGSVTDLLGGSNSGDVTTFLANLLGINPDDLSLDVKVNLVSGETDLDGLTGNSSDDPNTPSSGPSSSTPRVSSVLAASTSNAINRNIEAYAAQKDADTATIQKILQGLTSTKPANENTFYITNEDPEAVAYAVANTLQRQSESEELVWA